MSTVVYNSWGRTENAPSINLQGARTLEVLSPSPHGVNVQQWRVLRLKVWWFSRKPGLGNHMGLVPAHKRCTISERKWIELRTNIELANAKFKAVALPIAWETSWPSQETSSDKFCMCTRGLPIDQLFILAVFNFIEKRSEKRSTQFLPLASGIMIARVSITKVW